MDVTASPYIDRRAWLGLLARAPANRIVELLDAIGPRPQYDWLRPPEQGAVMVRGRAGATGAPFNLGEMTVTRCALRLGAGLPDSKAVIGHGYVQGRSEEAATAAALIDALMQTARAVDVRARVIEPLDAELSAARAVRAAKAAATKVEFFTMARGGDQ